MRKINRIIVHHSATSPSINVDRDWIDNLHKGFGFDGVGYHYVICRNGFVQIGRDLAKNGAHCIADGANRDSIGICLVGGVNNAQEPQNNYTPAQMLSLCNLIVSLQSYFVNLEVLGHKDLEERKPHCPMFEVKEWWKRIQDLLATNGVHIAEVVIT